MSGNQLTNNNLSVVLCTHNGEAYIQEQLQSIAGQKHLPSELIICDDASTDSTIGQIMSFSERSPFPVHLYRNESTRGVIANYSQALELSKSKYVALCDQDDIWLPDKLKSTLQFFCSAEKELGQGIPLLLHSDLTVIDESGKTIAPSFTKLHRIAHIDNNPLKRLLAHNFVTGCTVLMNRSLLDIALPLPSTALMHDWWLALFAAACGKILFLPQQTVLYRQHSTNLMGAKGLFTPNNLRRLSRIKDLEKRIAAIINQGLSLQEQLEKLPGVNSPSYLKEYLRNARSGGLSAALSAYRNGINQAGLARNIVFYLLLALGRYKKYLDQ